MQKVTQKMIAPIHSYYMKQRIIKHVPRKFRMVLKAENHKNPQPEDDSVLEMRVQQVLSILSLSFNIKQ